LRAWIRSLFANAGAKTLASLDPAYGVVLVSHCLGAILSLLPPGF
jgi:hypothetical protein